MRHREAGIRIGDQARLRPVAPDCSSLLHELAGSEGQNHIAQRPRGSLGPDAVAEPALAAARNTAERLGHCAMIRMSIIANRRDD